VSTAGAKLRTLVLMVLAMTIGYLPWYNFSAVLPLLQQELGLGSGEAGTILAGFQLGYVLVVLFTGWLADKLGAKWLITAGILGMAVCSSAFALLARDFPSALALRLFTGMAAGAIYAPGMALLANWFPPAQRGNAIGAFTGALTVAYAAAYFAAPPIAAAAGWRAGILWTSLPGLLAVIIMLAVRDTRDRAAPAASGPPAAGRARTLVAAPVAPAPSTRVVSAPGALITAAYMGHMWELYAFLGWVGPALVAAAVLAGVPQEAAIVQGGQTAALAILLGAPAPWLLGIAADRFGRCRMALLCLLFSAPASLLFGRLVGGPLPLTIALALWYGFWVIADSAIYKAGLTELVAAPIRATSLGLQSALGFGVSVLSPQLFGLVLQASNGGSRTPAVWGPAFAMLALGPAVGIALLLVLRRHPAAALMADGRR